MPRRDSVPVGAPCWIELSTSDPDRSRTFYGDLLGWTSVDAGPEYGGYIQFSRGDDLVAGGMANDPASGQPDGWLVYLASTDAAATVDAAKAAGGMAVVEAMDVMGLGMMAVVIDPGGAGIGVWQPGTMPGYLVYDEPGTPGWVELHTTDYPATVDFYGKVFSWDTHTMSDADDFKYTTYGKDEAALAGIMDEGSQPSRWSVYFRVESTDDAITKTIEQGGKVVTPAENTPWGRLAECADPTGALFKLMS